MAQQKVKKKADLKIILLGAIDVGKTCLVTRYIENSYDQDSLNTVGASFFCKLWGPHKVVIWDTAGEERFTSLSSFYCREAGAAIMTYDITSHDSFEALRSRFLPLIPEENCLKIIVGAKLDKVTDDSTRMVTRQEARQFAADVNEQFLAKEGDGQIPFFETSSKTGKGVEKTFEYIFEQCLSTPSNEYRNIRLKGTFELQDELQDDSKRPTNASKRDPKKRKKCC